MSVPSPCTLIKTPSGTSPSPAREHMLHFGPFAGDGDVLLLDPHAAALDQHLDHPHGSLGWLEQQLAVVLPCATPGGVALPQARGRARAHAELVGRVGLERAQVEQRRGAEGHDLARSAGLDSQTRRILRLWWQRAVAPEVVAGRPVGRPLSPCGSVEPPRAARRALTTRVGPKVGHGQGGRLEHARRREARRWLSFYIYAYYGYAYYGHAYYGYAYYGYAYCGYAYCGFAHYGYA